MPDMNNQTMIRVGAILAALAVVTGAISAHGIDWNHASRSATQWQTAVEYHMYHALGLVLCGLLGKAGCRAGLAGWCFLIGTVLFAGTLYGIGIGGPKWLGAITPIGGVAFIIGWLSLAARKNVPLGV